MAIGNDVLEGPDSGTRSAASLVSVGVLSFGALQTVSRTLKAHRESGLIDCAGEFFVHFNAITPEDKRVAERGRRQLFGHGRKLRHLWRFSRHRGESTEPVCPDFGERRRAAARRPGSRMSLEACVSDMIEHGVKCFGLRSRREPGEEWAPRGKIYRRRSGLVEPDSLVLPKQASLLGERRMFLEHGSIDKFRAASLFCERDPETVQKDAVRKLPSGNYMTDLRYRNWSNQAVLVERRYFFDVVCRRVEEHPDSRLVNGHQDIERALNRRWWRHRRDFDGTCGGGRLHPSPSRPVTSSAPARGGRPDKIDLERGDLDAGRL